VFNHKVKLKSIILITLLIIMLCFLGANGNGQQGGNPEYDINESTLREADKPDESIIENEVKTEDEQPEQKQTNLTVLLVDNINGSNLRLRNCILRLVGEMNIAEDLYTYDNFFVDGDIYKITVLIELNEVTEKSE